MNVRLTPLAGVAIAALAVSALPASAATVTAAPPGTAVASQFAASSTAPRTTLTLHFKRCGHCPVQLSQARWPGPTYWHSRSKRVTNGTVTFTVPTARTHGMAVTVSPRWQTMNAVPLVAFRYAHTTVGQEIPNSLARTKRHGSPCWAGTEARNFSMAIRVVKYPNPSPSGEPGNAIRVWAKTTRRATRPYERADDGALATQDVVVCGS